MEREGEEEEKSEREGYEGRKGETMGAKTTTEVSLVL